MLQNTFNAFRNIISVCKDSYEYYQYCEEVAGQFNEYAHTLSNDIVV